MGLGDWLRGANAQVERGLARLGEGLFAVDPSMNMDPVAVQRARQQAMLQLGLGLLARRSGLASYMGAQDSFQGAMQNAFQNAERRRLEQKADERYAAEQQYRSERDRAADRREEERERRLMAQAQAEQRLRERELAIRARQAERAGNLTRAELEAAAGAQARIAAENRRLQELMAKGWANLTDAEKEEFEVLRTGRRPHTGGLGSMVTPPFVPQVNPIALDDSLFVP